MKALLKIDSWIGISSGAIHYYGSLRTSEYTGEGYVDLKHKWSEGSAKRANKNHAWIYPGGKNKSPHKAGQETRCFDSREEVIECAIANYRRIFPDATSLELDTAYIDDKEVLHQNRISEYGQGDMTDNA